jgi:hypothetical protein
VAPDRTRQELVHLARQTQARLDNVNAELRRIVVFDPSGQRRRGLSRGYRGLSHGELSDLARLLVEDRDQVGRALGRLRQGLYGVCESCGQRISSARLGLRPQATRCVTCQATWERDQPQSPF